MKIFKLSLALAMAVTGIGMTATAEAHPRDHHRWEHRDRDHHRYRDYRRYDRPRHWSNRGYRDHRRCWTEWRHHRRVRVCR